MAITFYGNAINISLSVSLLLDIHTHSNWLPSIYKQFAFLRIICHLFAHFTAQRGRRQRWTKGGWGESGVSYTFLGKWFVSIATRIGLCVCVSICVWVSLPFSNVNPEKLFTRFWSFSLSSFFLDLARYAFGHVETATELNFPRQRPFMRFSSQFR